MTLRCAFCSKPDEVDAVCHHCGRPLCASDKCRFAKEPDGDFSGRVKAYHCRDCIKQHRRGLLSGRSKRNKI